MYPKNKTGKNSGMYFQVGLILAIAAVITAFEWKSELQWEAVALKGLENEVPDIPITVIEPPVAPPKPRVIPRSIVEVKEDPIEDQPDIFIDVVPDVIPDIPDIPEVKEEEVPDKFWVVEKMPEPIGGFGAFYEFTGKKLRYPKTARRLGIQGTVIVKFLVNEDGSLSDFEIMKGIGAGCDEESLRVLKMAPAWEPGKQRGVPVKVWKAMPIVFKLN